MKKIFILVMGSLLIFSCSPTIQVYDTLTNNSKLTDKYWVFENDSVKVTYEFWTNRGIMSFSIFNKVDKPIYVDWKNSSFIYNSNKWNYWVDEEISALQSYYGGYYYKGPLLKPGYSASAGVQNSSSKTIKPERITFIPPKSYYYRSQFYLISDDYYKIDSETATKKNIEGEKPEKSNSYYEVNFNYQNSPLKFRNYIAFSFSETSQSFFFIDNEFYVKSIKQMKNNTFRGKILGDGDYSIQYEFPFRKSTSFYFEFMPD